MKELSISNLHLKSKYGEPISVLNYRGYEIGFWNDDCGQQVFTVWEDKELGFGSYNYNYEDDMKYLIDEKLDKIADDYRWRLSWFYNGYNRDIKLEILNRIIKIWLVEDESKINIDKIIEEAKVIVEKILLH